MPLINKSLFVRLALLILGGTALVVLALVTFNHFEMRSQMLHGQQRYYTALAQSAAGDFKHKLLEVQKAVGEAAAIYPHLEVERRNSVDLLQRIMAQNTQIYGSAIALAPQENAKAAGFKILYTWREDGGTPVTERSSPQQDYQSDWFYLPYHLQRPVWTDPYYDIDTGTLMITYSVPVIVNTQVKAVIAGDLSLAGIESRLSGMQLGQHGFPFMVSRYGKFIVHPQHSWIHTETLYSLQESAPAPADRKSMAGIARALNENQSSAVRFKRYAMEEHAWLYFSTIPQTGWKMGFIIPEKQILAPVFALGVKTTLIALVGMVLLLIPAFVIARTVTRPIRSLCSAAEELAGGNFAASLPQERRRDEIGRLINSFEQMRTDLNTYIDKLTTTTAEKEKIASELSIAREIQHSILPKLFPPFPQRTGLDLFATLTSAREVGGDLYDFILLDDKRLYVCIGDVSDKGVPASLFMAVGKTLLKSTIQTISDPARALFHVNNEMVQGNDSCMFITLFCGIFDLNTRELVYANAGHNPPMVVDADGVKMLEFASAPPLAAMPDAEFSNQRLTLPQGAKLFLYTDGVTEAMNQELELFGEEHLVDLLRESGSRNAEGTIALVQKGIERFTKGADQSDDITMLCMSYAPGGEVEDTENSPASMLVLKNQRSELSRMVAWLEDLARQLKWPGALVTRLNLILEEWLVNVMSYAYTDADLHQIELRLWQNTEQIRIEIRDDGSPFNPTTAAQPDLDLPLEERSIGGLGLHFIRTHLDQWSYTRAEGHNIVTMVKDISS